MAPGRSNRPLFDMLDGARSKPRAPLSRGSVPSMPQVEPKPYVSPVHSHRQSRPDSGVRVGVLTRIRLAIRPFLGDSTMTLPANAVYYAAAGVVLAIVLAWVVGYRTGDASRAKKLAPFTNPQPLLIQEPSPVASAPAASRTSSGAGVTPVEANGSAQISNPPAVPGVVPTTTPKPVDVEVSNLASPTSADDVFLAQGWSPTDPREVGLNYLYLPIMTRTEAERAVRFLIANSMDAMAVPLKVDRRGPKVNNPPPADARYRVVFRRGLTGDEIRSEGSARQTMQASALRLGQVWKRDNRGTTDFSGYSWEKLVESR
jgi:hypothetical protein